MMCAAAGFEHYQTGRLRCHEALKLVTRQLLAEHNLAAPLCTVDLENLLGQIHPDHNILHLAVLFLAWR